MLLARDNPARSTIPPMLSPWRISTERYLNMIQAGSLDTDDKIELIHGMMIEIGPRSPKEEATLSNLLQLFMPIRENLTVAIRNTAVIAEGEVYDPDFMFLKPRPKDDPYMNRHPDPADVALLIEVAGSSLAKDRDVKLPVYAKAGVSEVWLVDIERETVQVCREPGAEGFASVEVVEKGKSVSAGCLAGQAVTIDSIVGS